MTKRRKQNETLYFIDLESLITCPLCGSTGPEVNRNFPEQFKWDCVGCHTEIKFQLKNLVDTKEGKTI